MDAVNMRLESRIGEFGHAAVGDEAGQALTLRRDGDLWLSRRTLKSDFPSENRVTETVHRVVPADVASEALDAVDRYACADNIPNRNFLSGASLRGMPRRRPSRSYRGDS